MRGRGAGRPGLRSLASAALLGLLLTACQSAAPTAPPQPRQTTTSLEPAAARSALARHLIDEGFTVDRDVGGFRVQSTDGRFMQCDTLLLRPRGRDTKQTRLTRPDQTTTTAAIRIEVAGERTRLSWEPRFVGSYLNRFDNNRFERPCRSSGVFEHLLSTALPN